MIGRERVLIAGDQERNRIAREVPDMACHEPVELAEHVAHVSGGR